MALIERLARSRRLPFALLLRFYPPFLFMGARVELSDDCRRLRLKLPLRWYGRNNNGALFGGFLCAASDPFPALLFERILPGVAAWTRSHRLDYLRPAQSAVVMRLEIDDATVAELRADLESEGRAERAFEYYFRDERGRRVARVTSTAYLQRRNGA